MRSPSPIAALVLAASLGAGVAAAQSKGARPLDIWVVDVEGGKAALFVTPTGQSVLVDSGWPGFDGRDPDRIMAAIADAGVKQIDYMLSTHYHVDHVGGLQELAKRIPIQHYVDHGPTVEGPLTPLREQVEGFWEAYGTLHGKAKRIVVRPGDRLPVGGLDWRIVTSAGDVLKTPLGGGGRANPACTQLHPADRQIEPSRPRRCAVGRQRDSARRIPRHRPRRSLVDQGARDDVPVQPDRRG